jgi:hypothetical protein
MPGPAPPFSEITMERVEPMDRDPDFARPIDPRARRPARRNIVWPLVILLVLVIAAAIAWRMMLAPEVAGVPPPQSTAPQPATPGPATTTPRYPIEAASAPAPPPAEALPGVADSDAALQDAMAAIFNGVPLDRIFHLQEIVPRFVATIDNLPRQTVALSKMPVQPVAGSIATSQSDGQVLLRADNAERYASYLRLMEQADTQKLVQTYVRFYPLFQKAYQDLGYPHGYFNDRLVEVIDHLLATPDVPAPVALTQPKVLYQFADPALEQLSAGQKIIIRMGPVNESRVKAKLRDIRRALTGQTLPR